MNKQLICPRCGSDLRAKYLEPQFVSKVYIDPASDKLTRGIIISDEPEASCDHRITDHNPVDLVCFGCAWTASGRPLDYYGDILPSWVIGNLPTKET
jgi:hypothetical protein